MNPTDTRAHALCETCQCSKGGECDCGMCAQLEREQEHRDTDRWTPLQAFIVTVCAGLALWCLLALAGIAAQTWWAAR